MSTLLNLTGQPPQNLSGLVLQGAGDPIDSAGGAAEIADEGETGVLVADGTTPSDLMRLRDFTLSRFNGSALKFTSHIYMSLSHVIDSPYLSQSHIGAEITGQYCTISNLFAHFCTYGVKVTSGNVKVMGGTVTANDTGFWLYGGSNDAHGQVIGLTANHNTTNLKCEGITQGETFGDCHFISGAIRLVNSKGIRIDGGNIDASSIYIDATSILVLRNVQISGSVGFEVEEGGIIDAEGCWLLPGATVELNGVPWDVNTSGGGGSSGELDGEIVSDSYTATLTGCSGTAPTFELEYTKIGDAVILSFPSSVAITGPGNSTVHTLTGMPTGLRPTGDLFWLGTASQDGGTVAVARFKLDTSGVITFQVNVSGGAWESSSAINIRMPPLPYKCAT